jgi:hypothetical protein
MPTSTSPSCSHPSNPELPHAPPCPFELRPRRRSTEASDGAVVTCALTLEGARARFVDPTGCEVTYQPA